MCDICWKVHIKLEGEYADVDHIEKSLKYSLLFSFYRISRVFNYHVS